MRQVSGRQKQSSRQPNQRRNVKQGQSQSSLYLNQYDSTPRLPQIPNSRSCSTIQRKQDVFQFESMLSQSKINFNSSLKKRNLGSKNANGTLSSKVLVPLEPTHHHAGWSQKVNSIWKDKQYHNEYGASQPSSDFQEHPQGEFQFKTPSKRASGNGLQGPEAQGVDQFENREDGAELPADSLAIYLQQCTHSMRIVGESDVVEGQDAECIQMPVIQIFLSPQLFQPRVFAAHLQKALSSDKPSLLSQVSTRCNFNLLLNAEIGCQVLKYANNQVIFRA